MAHNNAVSKYYDQTYLDYFWMLNLKKHHNLHYGYFDGNARTIPQAIRALNVKLAKVAGIQEGQHILDAGCGVGGSSVWLAEKFNVCVTGITIVDSQVAMAKKLAKKHKVGKRVTFENRDFLKTGYADNAFDVVWAIESMSHAKDKQKFVQESFRILKPGGVLVISDGFLGDVGTKNKMEEYQQMLDGWIVPNLVTTDTFKEFLLKTRFQNLKIYNSTKKVLPFSKRLYLLARIGLPISIVLQFFRVRNKTQTGNVRTALLQYPALKRGVWEYGILSAVKPKK